MVTNAIVCPQCRRVIALSGALPATCFGGIPADELTKLGGVARETDARTHHDCVEIEVTVADELSGIDKLAEVERTYETQIAALGGLASLAKGGG
jgi:hypothetical protein